jgi:hypothetical protein
MDSYKDAHAREHALLEQAVDHTKEAMEYRLASLNEWRAQNQDERAHFVTLDKYEGLQKRLSDHIETENRVIVTLEKKISSLNGRIAGGVAVLMVVFALIQILLRYFSK